MPSFNFLKRKQQVKGEIGYFGLGDWWLSTFSDVERKYIQETFKSLSTGGERSATLTEGTISFTTQTAAGLLWGLASRFKKPNDLSIAKRLLDKAEEVADDPLDLHFTYQQMIEVFYRSRELDPSALDLAVQACIKQIALAPQAAKAFKKEYKGQPLPEHRGYEQLAIVREKEKNYTEVIRLCQQAKQQGWNGDWDKRIARCQEKLSRMKQ